MRLVLAPSDHAESLCPARLPGKATTSGTLRRIHTLLSSASFHTAAKAPAAKSERALASDSAPAECMVRMVSAQTTPLGKRSCSALISVRFKGMATTTPSTEMPSIHRVSRSPSSSGMPRMVPSARSMAIAGIELTRPAEDMYAAAEAAVCAVLFSSMENGRMPGNTRPSAAKSAKPTTLAVIPMPKLQPILSPM